MHRDFTGLGKPSVFVTNSPYPDMVAPEMDTVLFVGNSNARTLRRVAEILRAVASRRQADDPSRCSTPPLRDSTQIPSAKGAR